MRFFAAGHGDSILLSTSSGHRVLVDAGRFMMGDHLVRRRLIPFFKRRGIKHLDGFVLTHPHPDHLGDPVMLRKHVAFETIYTNADGANLLRGLASRLARAGGRPMRIATVAAGDTLRWGDLVLRVLNPPRHAGSPGQVQSLVAQNNRSVVLRVAFGQITFLLTGDLSLGGERRLLATGADLRAQVLKLGHHGRGSTSEAWLRRVRPRYAVATCGDYMGRVQRVSPKILRRLKRHGVKLFGTDQHGDVLFVTDGRRLRVKTYPELVHRPK